MVFGKEQVGKMAERSGALKAPLWLTFILIVLIVLNAIAALESVAFSPQYAGLDIPFAPGVKIVGAALWTVVLTALLVGLLRQRRWAFMSAGPVLTAHSIGGLLWAFAFFRADYARGILPFQTVAAVILLIPIWWVALRGGWMRRANS